MITLGSDKKHVWTRFHPNDIFLTCWGCFVMASSTFCILTWTLNRHDLYLLVTSALQCFFYLYIYIGISICICILYLYLYLYWHLNTEQPRSVSACQQCLVSQKEKLGENKRNLSSLSWLWPKGKDRTFSFQRIPDKFNHKWFQEQERQYLVTHGNRSSTSIVLLKDEIDQL